MSPTCYEEVKRKLTTSRGSYEELVPVEFGLKSRIITALWSEPRLHLVMPSTT